MHRLPEVKDLLDRVKKPPFNDNVTALMDEIEALHVSRQTLKWKASRIDSPKLIEAFAEASAFRSRIVGIRVLTARKLALLKGMLEGVTDHIWTVKGTFLANSFGSKPEREKAIRLVLKSAYKKLRRYESLIDMADMVINDLDQAQWSLKGILAALELSTKREMKL